MEDRNLKLSHKYLRLPVIILHMVGLWRTGENFILYYFYSFIFVLSTQYCYAISQLIYMYLVWGEIEKIAEASFLLLTQATLCLKIFLFTWHHTKIRSLYAYMDGENFFPRRPKHWTVINESCKKQTGEFVTFLFLALFTIIQWAFLPVIEGLLSKKILPIKAWFPFPEETPYYEVIYFYQIIGITLSAMINTSLDRIPTAMIALGCAQVEILMDNIENMQTYAMEDHIESNKNKTKKNALPPNSQENNNNALVWVSNKSDRKKMPHTYEEFIENLLDKYLKDCISHHQNIVRFITNVEECFTLGILTQFAASVIIICITGLQLTLVDPNSFRFFTKIWYMAAMLSQVFFFCKIGNDITAITSQLVETTFKCPWIERPKKFKTTLMIFMERLKKPIITRAGNFFPLSLQTFITLLRSSYSYFAVLQQMNAK